MAPVKLASEVCGLCGSHVSFTLWLLGLAPPQPFSHPFLTTVGPPCAELQAHCPSLALWSAHWDILR